MEHHIDRRVVLNQDPESKNLYKWCLQELDAEGKKIGRDQIPWYWNLCFTATELTFGDGITIEPDYRIGYDDAKMAVQEKQTIRAKLRPGYPWEENLCRQTTYSMFGTDRTISAFELFIAKLEGEDKMEHCWAWGSVSYKTDIDFRVETTDDTVIFYLYVRPETFARYAEAIAGSKVDEAILRVGRVAGFYSGWSPASSTSDVKVLTNNPENVVEMPDDCDIVPRRLGEVGEATFNLLRIAKLETSNDGAAEDDDWLKEDAPSGDQPDRATQAAQHLANVNARAVALLTSLRIAAWVIAVLLFLILVT